MLADLTPERVWLEELVLCIWQLAAALRRLR
jgi:hypothetical protein